MLAGYALQYRHARYRDYIEHDRDSVYLHPPFHHDAPSERLVNTQHANTILRKPPKDWVFALDRSPSYEYLLLTSPFKELWRPHIVGVKKVIEHVARGTWGKVRVLSSFRRCDIVRPRTIILRQVLLDVG